ncbi:hypothetical protein BSKO_08166 [Bryopsis sp. KO-2023]|nr:hypothetical protein BSKO_08166 [Bryopsis sp. KO-2023]
MTVSKDLDKSVYLARYAPILAFHPRERYYPLSVPAFVAKAELRLLNRELRSKSPKLTHDVLYPPGAATIEHIVNASRVHPIRKLQLQASKENRAGVEPSKLDETPLYAVVKDIADKHGNTQAIEINYFFFCAFNSPYYIVGKGFGGHVGDFEHVTVRLCPDGRLQGVYYNAHRNIDGNWVPAKKVRLLEGRPLVYVARDHHGCYPSPGIKLRIFGLANDFCSGAGPKWRPRKIIRLEPHKEGACPSRGSMLSKPRQQEDETPKNMNRGNLLIEMDREGAGVQIRNDEDGWGKYQGYWGTIANATAQDWYKNAEHPVSRGWFKRLFCPCLSAPFSIA